MTNGAGVSAEREFIRSRRSRSWSVAIRLGLALAVLVIGGVLARGVWVAGNHRHALVAGSVSALVGAVAIASALRRAGSDPARWARGAAGERLTADLLSELSSRRWTVLHDLAVPGSTANIDHLIVGPTGVWLVDTKTTLEEVRIGWRSVRFGDRPIDPDPTSWEAGIVADRLDVAVRPLIAVHGRNDCSHIPSRGRRIGGGVRVVSADHLVSRLRRGRRRLGRREVAELSDLAYRAFAGRSASVDRGARVRRVGSIG